MKRIYINFKIVSALFALFIICSCEDGSDIFTVTEANSIVLSELEITNIELDNSNPNNPAATFNWTQANYGQPASENYRLEVAIDESFTNPVVAATSIGTTTVTLTVNELNSAAGNAGLPAFQLGTLFARVISSLGAQNELPVASNAISFNVLPYYNYLYDEYYLVGNGVAPGWSNNNNNPPLFRNPDNDQAFYYTGYFDKVSSDYNEGRFKVLEEKGLWQPQWGVTANEGEDDVATSGPIAGNPGTQDSDPGRFGVPSSGYYTFMIDFGTREYTLEPYDASGATSYTSMTAQGTSLSGDVSLTQSTFDSHIWYTNNVVLAPGDLQFMTNTGSVLGGSTEFSGQATENGGPIPVVIEDEYDIWFNDLTGDYILIPLNL